jgi:hypothetical protein
MNKNFTLIITLALALCSINLLAQIEIDTCVTDFYFDNEDPPYEFIYIDSLNNPQNIWQIGVPEKDNISLPYTPYVSIVTDTMLPYPTNDTSSFIVAVCHYSQYGFMPTFTVSNWELDYYIDSDSLNDYGMIEISIDQGNTWWELLSAGWPHGDTIFTGNLGRQGTLKFDPTFVPYPDFENHMIDISNSFTTPIDTMWIKFTFISDGNPEEKMGWVIESLTSSQGLYSSVEDIRANSFAVHTFPNPANNILNLQIEKEDLDDYDIRFFNTTGKLIYQTSIQNDYQKEIDVSSFPKGIYHYVVTKLDDQQKGFGKLIIQ